MNTTIILLHMTKLVTFFLQWYDTRGGLLHTCAPPRMCLFIHNVSKVHRSNTIIQVSKFPHLRNRLGEPKNNYAFKE